MHESVSHGRWCARYIRQHHEEIDFVYNDSWHLFGVSLVTKALRQYRIPYITPVQDVYPESLASKLPEVQWLKRMVMQVLSPLDHYVLSHAVCVQTNSEKMAAYLSDSRQIERKKFVVVRNWQDEKPFLDYAQHQRLKSEDKPFTFMYVGNVGPLAGIEILFEAFAQAGLKDARLVIAGSGPAKEALQRQSQRYACTIEFWDVPTGKVPETQAKADVMLLPVKKGFARYSVPSKLAAYLFSAKPVIASVDKDSDTAECVEKSGAGWVVEPDDAQQIASVMCKAFECPRHILEEMGEQGLAFSIGNFSKEKNLMMLAEACERAINNR
jgi:glycosyltransferase involved in cell wall biosynthesis